MVAYLISFAVVLAASIVSKGSIIFVTQQVKRYERSVHLPLSLPSSPPETTWTSASLPPPPGTTWRATLRCSTLHRVLTTWHLSHQVDLTCRKGENLYVPEYTECTKNKEVIPRIIFKFPTSVFQIEKVAWIWVIAFAFAAPQVTNRRLLVGQILTQFWQR